MNLQRINIKKTNIPSKYMEELLDTLEKGLKSIETKLEEEVVYGVINNIIKDRYENNKGYKSLDKEFLLDLTKDVIENEGNEQLIKIWFNLSNKVLNSNVTPINRITPEEAMEIEYGIDMEGD